jgi:integral membrane protein
MTPLGWFLRVARVEGVSLLALVGVCVPLKYGLGIPEPTAWVGWAHGVLVFLFLLALWSAARVEGWTLRTVAVAFACSLVPGGTFVFEAWLVPDAAGTRRT